MGFKGLLNKAVNNFRSHTASLAPKEDAMYSASVELNATEVCFRLDQETIPDPRLKQYLEVLFRSIELSAQSESEYPRSSMLTLSYLIPIPIVPFRYLNIYLATCRCIFLGAHIN